MEGQGRLRSRGPGGTAWGSGNIYSGGAGKAQVGGVGGHGLG